MKYGFAGIGLFLLFGLAFAGMLMFSELSISNEEDYYLLKETMEASLMESIDKDYLRNTGKYKIIQEKFIESFTRRYSESAMFNAYNYTIEFYDIIEMPPKATVVVNDGTNKYDITGGYGSEGLQSFNIENHLTGILVEE